MSIGDAFVSIDRPKPVTLGHEGAGWVEKLHTSAEGKGFKKGDAVGFLYIIDCCFECEGCMVHNNHCLKQQSQTQGFTFDGFFAEYALVDYHSATVLPEALDVRLSSPLFCAGVTSFHCVESCELKAGENLVVVGCGGLGQIAVQIAHKMGHRVFGVDISDDILTEAKKQGADYTFNNRSNTSYAKDILELTDGRGADAVAVFSAAEAAYASATQLVRLGGTIMVVGLPAKGVTFNALDIARGTYKVRGDSTGISQRMPRAIEFIAKNGIRPEMEVYNSLVRS